MRLVLVILIMLFSDCQAGIPEAGMAKPAGLATPDGIWYQYGGPQVVSGGGKTFWGWVNTDGDIKVASFDHTTKSIHTALLATGFYNPDFYADDHAPPSLLIRSSDNKMIVVYTKHHDGILRWRISNDAYSIETLGTERTLDLSSDGAFWICYPQPVEVSSESQIYIFHRSASTSVGDDRYWKYVVSTDDGETFGNPATLRENFQSSEGEYIINPYTMAVPNGASRIDFLSYDYEQIGRGGTPRNIYHWYYESGAYYRSDGTKIKDLADGHIESQSEVTTIHETTDTNIWDIAIDPDGYPVIVYVKFVDYDNDHQYRYARWDGTRWHHYEVASGGGPVSEASGREWYSGGICLNRRDTSIVYLSEETSPNVFEIRQLATPDGGQNWIPVEKYYGKTNSKSFRPRYPRNADEDYIKLMFISGGYIDLNDYDTSILAYPAFSDSPSLLADH